MKPVNTNNLLMDEDAILDACSEELNLMGALFHPNLRLPCFERCGGSYRMVHDSRAYNLGTPEGREAWKEAAPERDRIIAEDGLKYIDVVKETEIEPRVEKLVADLLTQRLHHYTEGACLAGELHDEYVKERDAGNSWEDYFRKEFHVRKAWAERNLRIAEQLEAHPEGMSCHQLYNALSNSVAKSVSYDTFRKWLYDNRCAFKLKPKGDAGHYQVVRKRKDERNSE